MTGKHDIILLGAGGHGRVLMDVLKRGGHAVAGVTDADPLLKDKRVDGIPILGGDEVVLGRDASTVLLANGVGNAARGGDAGLRSRLILFERFKAKGYFFATIVCPTAVVSETAMLSEGAQILTGAIVHPGSHVGINAVINTGAQVDHDCRVGDHSHIAPGAVLCGNVTIGNNCHIGAGAVIVQGISVCAGAVIGAGAVVVADVAEGATVMGNPARPPRM